MTTAREDFDQLRPDGMPPQSWTRIGDDLFAKHAAELAAEERGREAVRMNRLLDSRYAGQMREPGQEWRTVAADRDVYQAGWKLTEVMQAHGLDYTDTVPPDRHITHMICGNRITAPDGTEFRMTA